MSKNEPPSKVTLEICTASIEDAIVAEANGADRIELNSALPLGGLTPTGGTLAATLTEVSIPVIAMSRPRESGFCYSPREFDTLVQDADWMLGQGAHGIAFGVLNENGRVDIDRCQQIVSLIGPDRDAVFHRAFDLIEDQAAAMESLIKCGVTRIMTSGGKPTAWQGRQQIAALVHQAAGRIQILAAGAIRQDHVVELVCETGVDQIHAGLGQPAFDPGYQNLSADQVNFYGELPANPGQFRQSSPAAIQAMDEALRSVRR